MIDHHADTTNAAAISSDSSVPVQSVNVRRRRAFMFPIVSACHRLPPLAFRAAMLGTTYGGDGRTTFGLPDLRGRAALHQGAGPGLTNRRIGEKAGAETVPADASTMPTHTHVATLKGTTQPAGQLDDTPTGKVLAKGNQYSIGNSDTDMGATSITNADTGGGQAHVNMQPFLVINFCIALTGVFPSRN